MLVEHGNAKYAHTIIEIHLDGVHPLLKSANSAGSLDPPPHHSPIPLQCHSCQRHCHPNPWAILNVSLRLLHLPQPHLHLNQGDQAQFLVPHARSLIIPHYPDARSVGHPYLQLHTLIPRQTERNLHRPHDLLHLGSTMTTMTMTTTERVVIGR